MDATWSKGDTKQVISTSATSPSFAMFGGTSAPAPTRALVSVRQRTLFVSRRCNGGDGSLHLTTAWGFRGAFNHNWDPYWSSSLFGSYSAVRYDDTAKLTFCAYYAGCQRP